MPTFIIREQREVEIIAESKDLALLILGANGEALQWKSVATIKIKGAPRYSEEVIS